MASLSVGTTALLSFHHPITGRGVGLHSAAKGCRQYISTDSGTGSNPLALAEAAAKKARQSAADAERDTNHAWKKLAERLSPCGLYWRRCPRAVCGRVSVLDL